MQHEVRRSKGASILSLQGDVDLESSPKARAVLLECVETGGDVIVDLSGVDYIDSSGVASLVEAYQASKKRGSRFVLASVSASAMRVLQLARLDKVFTICASVEEGINGGA